VDHSIETEPGAKPPHRPFYQLSPAELHTAKEYVIDMMHKGKIRPSKSPYGAPLFFVKDGLLRSLVVEDALTCTYLLSRYSKLAQIITVLTVGLCRPYSVKSDLGKPSGKKCPSQGNHSHAKINSQFHTPVHL
jgi:hypothetical protein